MINMAITFATPENMDQFWSFVKTLLSFASPWVMIAFAILAVGFLLVIIVNAWKNAGREEDEDEIEVRHY